MPLDFSVFDKQYRIEEYVTTSRGIAGADNVQPRRQSGPAARLEILGGGLARCPQAKTSAQRA
jgi:hypothetical protein